MSNKRIAIFVVAYNHVNLLDKTLDRIPKDVLEKVEEIFVFDDCSTDNTYYAALGYKKMKGLDKLKIFKNTKNLGYGGNQKAGYRYAIEKGFDIVVLLHGDGQYAPEVLPSLLEPLERDEADMVFGSRMAKGGTPLEGGMPLYKYLGNKILTFAENKMLGMSLSEFHSGYRLYSCHALKQISFERFSDDFHFDTEIIILFKDRGLRIFERPIPTYYGNEICNVNGLHYAYNCLKAVTKYWMYKHGFLKNELFESNRTRHYLFKNNPYSSHSKILNLVSRFCSGKEILDVGASRGYLVEHLVKAGYHATAIEKDPQQAREIEVICEKVYTMDIEETVPPQDEVYDLIIFGDVLEHLRNPWEVLKRYSDCLREGGKIIVSLPNTVHIIVRMMILLGKFEYMARGPLDKTHLRFFTKKSATKMVKEAGFTIDRVEVTSALSFINSKSRVFSLVNLLAYFLARVWPGMFAYQFVILATKDSSKKIDYSSIRKEIYRVKEREDRVK
jgi:glycosyltransferase involved in cell wall biosynthesis